MKVITKLPNSEQSYKGKVKTHKYINRPNQSTLILLSIMLQLNVTCSSWIYCFLTIHQHLTISCIVCYFWWYACLKCGVIHIAWRNLMFVCYMCKQQTWRNLMFVCYICIIFYYLRRCLSFFLWLVHFFFELYTWQYIYYQATCVVWTYYLIYIWS